MDNTPVDFDDEQPARPQRLDQAEKSYTVTPALFDAVCEYICNGGNAINYIRKNSMVSYSAFMAWVSEDSARQERYNQSLRARTEWFVQRLIAELKALSFTDIREMYDDNNRLKDIKDIPEGIRRAIASIEVDEIYDGKGEDKQLIGYTRKVKLWDKKGAIDSFMKHLGMFIERLEVKQTVSITVNKVDLDDRINQLSRSRLPSEN